MTKEPIIRTEKSLETSQFEIPCSTFDIFVLIPTAEDNRDYDCSAI